MGTDFINMVNNFIKRANNSSRWVNDSIGTVNNFMMLFSMREKFQTPESWFRVENGFTLLNSTKIDFQLVMISNTIFLNVSYCLMIYKLMFASILYCLLG